MKKDRTRDYAVSAFRDYALKKSTDGLTLTQLQDRNAVEETLNFFMRTNNPDVVRIVKAVYFVDAEKKLRKEDVTNRVNNIAIEIPISDRQVYKYLQDARKKFAELRGLTTDKSVQ